MGGSEKRAGLVSFAGFQVDLEKQQLRTEQGEHVALRPRSSAVLCLLASKMGELITKDEIISNVWSNVAVTDDSITQCIADIRRAIRDRDHAVVRTVSRRGYILIGPHASQMPIAQSSAEYRPGPAAEAARAGPETRYARSGEYYIAYQATGDGPVDIVFVQGYATHLEIEWEDHRPAQFYERLACIGRLIRFDKRGTGLSDRVKALPTLEERMDDVRAVMDAVGSKKAILLGSSEGAAMSLLFCATYPERVAGLVLYGAFARLAWSPDNPWGRTQEQVEARLRLTEEKWGSGHSVDLFAPSIASVSEYRKWRARLDRASATPGTAVTLLRMNYDIDVRDILASIRVPTIILHRTDDRAVPVEHSRYMAQHIPHARYVELSGPDHAPWVGDTESICAQIEDFARGITSTPLPERVLGTVLFANVGDHLSRVVPSMSQEWRRAALPKVAEFRGREIEMDGNSIVAVFDGPVRAIRCAQSVVNAMHEFQMPGRAGVHTSELDVWGDTLERELVQICSGVANISSPGEVVITSTVADLVAGSGLRLYPRGVHVLDGVPGRWKLHAAM